MSHQCILCLDDEKIVLHSLRGELVRNFGSTYNYEFLDDPFDAIEVIDELNDGEGKVIVVISDWQMPGMKGDEFLSRIHDRYPSIVKIMLTGQADPEAIERTKKEANLFRCIYKPWSAADLANIIREAVQTLKS